MKKKYRTPHRTHVVKTRMNDAEYEAFRDRTGEYHISQSEFIRRAVAGAKIRPVIRASYVNDELLAAIGKLTAEYGKIGSNLNQIARNLNEGGRVSPEIIKQLENTAVDLAELKHEIMKKAGDAIGNVQTYQL